MKKTIFGIIILGIMATAAASFNSCSCNRGAKEVELDDSTKLALEMERKLREDEFDSIVDTDDRPQEIDPRWNELKKILDNN